MPRHRLADLARPVPPATELLDLGQALEYLGMSESFLRRHVRDSTVAYYRLGAKALRFHPRDLDKLISRGPLAARAVEKSNCG